MATEDIIEGARPMCEKYTNDFKEDFSQEFIQFVAYVRLPSQKKDTETKSMWLYRSLRPRSRKVFRMQK